MANLSTSYLVSQVNNVYSSSLLPITNKLRNIMVKSKMLFTLATLVIVLSANATTNTGKAIKKAMATSAPTSFVASSITSTSMTIGWTAPASAPTGYIVLRTTSSGSTYPNTSPANAMGYTVGNTLGNATVVYVGTSTTAAISSLSASSQYSYAIYGYDDHGASVTYSNGVLQGQAYTVATNGFAAQPTNFSVVTNYTSGTLSPSWTIPSLTNYGSNAGYLLIYAPAGTTATLSSVNGTSPSVATGCSYVTIANAYNNNTSITGLSSCVNYNFLLVPYTWDGSNAATYNYFTTGAPTANQTTYSLPVLASLTNSVTSSTAATLGATISLCGSTITARGIEWSTTSGNENFYNPNSSTNGSATDGATSAGAYTVSFTGLAPQTHIYFKGYSNGAGQSYSSESSFYTFSNPATAQPSSFTTSVGSTQIIANWTTASFPASGATKAGYLVIYAPSGTTPSLSSANGNTPVAGAGTLVNITSTTLPTTPALTTTITGLTSGTTYNLLLIPYTWDGVNTSTYNYLTASAKTATGTPSAAITPTVTVTPIGTYTYTGTATGPNAATNTGTGTSYTFSYAGTGATTYGPTATAPTNAGTYTVTATVAANGNYTSASSSATAFTIATASLTITASAQSKTYGAFFNAGTTAFTTSGLVGSDAVTSVTLSTEGTINVGTYPITPSNAVGTGLSNYTITYVNGILTVNPAPLTITASAQSKTYSTTLSLGTTAFTATGLKSTDAISAVTLTSAGTVNTAAVGVYSIVPSAAVFSSGSSSNYTITYTNSTLTVNAGAVGLWVGLTSSDINTLSNWQSYSVPPASSNITIPAGTPYVPVLAAIAEVNNLNIATGVAPSLNGMTLIIDGAISGGGTLTSTPTSSLVINGAAGTINFTSGSNTIQNLTLNSGATATLGTQLNIVAGSNAGTVTIASGATLTTGGNLVLKSDINGTARIAQSAGSISGNVTVERYISAKTARKYSYIGSPVTANIRNSWQQQIYITGAGRGGSPCGATTGNGAASTDKYNTNGFDATSINATSMFTYSATLVNGSRYVSIPNTISTNLTPGIGYVVNVRGNRNSATVTCADQLASNYPTAPEAVTLSATGTVTTGDLTVALNNPSVYAFTLLANPYPSQISFTAFQASNSNINGTMWTYNPTGNGNYTTYSNGIIVNGATSFDNTSGNYIASGQAFFVQANAAGTVTFHESHKTSGALPNTKYFGTTVNKMVRVALKDEKDSSVLDEIVVRYNSNGSEVYTQGWDASSLSSGSQALASVKGTKRLAIATHSDAATADTTKLYVKSTSVGAFKLSFSDFKDIDNAKAIILVDKFLGTKQDIRANQVYDFKVTSDTTSVGYNRFEVIVGGTNTSALPVSFTAISATKAGNAVNVKWNTAKETNIASYEVERSSNGVAFTTINSTKAEAATSYAIEDASIPATASTLYYRIKAIGTDGTTEYSAIAKLSTHNSSLSTISIYPNPVKTALNITLGSTNGNYDVRIATIAGQQVFGKSGATLTNGKLTLDASNFASGVYVLELVDAKGNRQQEKFIKE